MPTPKGHPPYNTNGEGGRPVIYTDEVIELEAQKLNKWLEKRENIFLEAYCRDTGLDRRLASQWAKKNERFSDAYDKLQNNQKLALMLGGLTKKLAHPMCALLLGHSHGIVAKTEQKISGDSVNPLAVIFENTDGKTKELVNE